MDENIHLIWKILAEYISAKDRESAAHHLVSELIDSGVEEEDLWSLCKGNPVLRKAVTEAVSVPDDLIEDEDDE